MTPADRIRRDLRNLFGPNSVQERDLDEALEELTVTREVSESVPRGNRPATEAGKALVEWAENAVPEQVEVWRDHAALIEEEARQPALDAYRSLIEWLPTLIDGKDRARTNDLIRAAIEDGKRTEARLLDEVGVAGLTEEHGS